jgi:hypothetical protein
MTVPPASRTRRLGAEADPPLKFVHRYKLALPAALQYFEKRLAGDV